MHSSVLLPFLLALLTSAIPTPINTATSFDMTGITCHEDLPAYSNPGNIIVDCRPVAAKFRDQASLDCYSTFQPPANKDSGGVCNAYSGPGPCQLIITLEIPEGRHASEYPRGFNTTDVADAGDAIANGCFRGGKKYLPKSNSGPGIGGWYVEITEGFSPKIKSTESGTPASA